MWVKRSLARHVSLDGHDFGPGRHVRSIAQKGLLSGFVVRSRHSCARRAHPIVCVCGGLSEWRRRVALISDEIVDSDCQSAPRRSEVVGIE